MKICVLNDPNWSDVPFDPGYYLQGHEYEIHDVHWGKTYQELSDLSKRDFDIFLNMCDGAADEDRPGIDVVLALEALNVAFTGAASHYYEPTRDQMKKVCRKYGIRVPEAVTVNTTENLKEVVEGLAYPLIVKHFNSYGSIGLIKDSRVETFAALEQQVARTLGLFGGAMIEEFIDGREFSCLISENPDDQNNPIAYTPVEFIFPEGESFKHTDIKWVRYDEMTCRLVQDETLKARLQDMSKKLFVGIDGTSYGRCDIRMNQSGELFMLEINPQGAVFYPPNEPGAADLILQNDPGGHAKFVDLLFRSAFVRQARRSAMAQPIKLKKSEPALVKLKKTEPAQTKLKKAEPVRTRKESSRSKKPI